VETRDRAAGCLLGLALGDATGAPFEFRRASAIPDPLPALELPWQGLPPGTTTDDTAMSVNLAASLVERGELDLDDVVRRHLDWFRSGPPDVGALTRRVLRSVHEGTAAEASRVAREIWERRGPEVSAGNGSVMYCAPLGVAYANRPDALHEMAPALSALTHVDGRCRTACLAITLAVAGLVRGESPAAAVRAALLAVADGEGGEELEFLTEAVGSSRPVDGPDQGFCLYAAAIGLQAALRSGAFDAEVARVVRLGGDTDTNAAVAGALLGARDGVRGLPPVWLSRLRGREDVEFLAPGLALLASETGET
jgi:ADP-ribosyl-[dinitrogen reductase] hydrolase